MQPHINSLETNFLKVVSTYSGWVTGIAVEGPTHIRPELYDGSAFVLRNCVRHSAGGTRKSFVGGAAGKVAGFATDATMTAITMWCTLHWSECTLADYLYAHIRRSWRESTFTAGPPGKRLSSIHCQTLICATYCGENGNGPVGKTDNNRNPHKTPQNLSRGETKKKCPPLNCFHIAHTRHNNNKTME